MIRKPFLPFLLAALATLAGCGGSNSLSGVTGRAPTEATRSNVQRNLGLGLRSSAMSGGSMGGGMMAFGGGGGSMGSGMGGIVLGEGGGGSTGSGGSGGGSTSEDPNFYYADWYELWVEVVETASGTTMNLYVDEAKTQPAGHITSTQPADYENYPQEYSYSYEILAGPQAGSRGTYETTLLTDSIGSMRYANTYADGSSDQGESNWNQDRYAWTSRYDGVDGYWYRDSHSFDEDGGESSWSDSNGYGSRFVHNPDGSGSGVIQGPDPGLPATIRWTAEGRVTIRWADGTIEEYTWGWCEEGVGGGGSTEPGG